MTYAKALYSAEKHVLIGEQEVLVGDEPEC